MATEATGYRHPPERPGFRLILPRQAGAQGRAAEFWRARRLLRYFSRRLLEKQYARTWLGWLWLPLRPIIDVGSQALVFGGIVGISTGQTPYLLFVLLGMPVWQLFSRVAYWATRSLELNRRYLTRLYIPRLVLLVSAIGPGLVTFGLYMAIGVIAVLGYLIVDGTTHLAVGIDTLLVPVGLALVLAIALGIGLFTSIYGAQARDVRFGLSYVLGWWYLLTPVIYPLSQVPAPYRTLAELNPMTAPIEMVRLGLLGTGSVPTLALGITVATLAVLWTAGLLFFLRSEAEALDHL